MMFMTHLFVSSCYRRALNCRKYGVQCGISECGVKPSWKEVKQPNKVSTHEAMELL